MKWLYLTQWLSSEIKCHDPFPELSPSPCSYTMSYWVDSSTLSHDSKGCMNWSQPHLTMPHRSPMSHLRSQPRSQSEWDPHIAEALGTIFSHVAIMWWSNNQMSGRPPHQQTWDLRVPTLIPFHLFPSYWRLTLHWLLHSCCMCTCYHSQLKDWLYAPLCPVHASI